MYAYIYYYYDFFVLLTAYHLFMEHFIHLIINLFILCFGTYGPPYFCFFTCFLFFPPLTFTHGSSSHKHLRHSHLVAMATTIKVVLVLLERERERERRHTTTLPERPWLITFYENGVKSFLGVDSSLGGSLYPACHIENMRKYLHKIWNMDLIKIY